MPPDAKDKKEKDDVKEKGAAKEDAAAADGAQPADKTKSVVILLIIISVLVMVLTPVITIFAIKSIAHKEEEQQKPKEVNKKSMEISLAPQFKFNISQTQGTRVGLIDVVVEVSDGAAMENFFKAKTKEIPDGMQNKIRSTILTILSDKTLDGLLSKDAKANLSKEIKAELNEMLQKKADGVVTEVYFPSFVIQ
jgi:flagellar basal body-associated protein FliL